MKRGNMPDITTIVTGLASGGTLTLILKLGEIYLKSKQEATSQVIGIQEQMSKQSQLLFEQQGSRILKLEAVVADREAKIDMLRNKGDECTDKVNSLEARIYTLEREREDFINVLRQVGPIDHRLRRWYDDIPSIIQPQINPDPTTP